MKLRKGAPGRGDGGMSLTLLKGDSGNRWSWKNISCACFCWIGLLFLMAVDWLDELCWNQIMKELHLQDPEEVCQAVYGGGQNQHLEATEKGLGSLQLCDDWGRCRSKDHQGCTTWSKGGGRGGGRGCRVMDVNSRQRSMVVFRPWQEMACTEKLALAKGSAKQLSLEKQLQEAPWPTDFDAFGQGNRLVWI